MVFPTIHGLILFDSILSLCGLINFRLSLYAVDSSFKCVYLTACCTSSYFTSAHISMTTINLPPSILNSLFVNVTTIHQSFLHLAWIPPFPSPFLFNQLTLEHFTFSLPSCSISQMKNCPTPALLAQCLALHCKCDHFLGM